MLVEIGHFALVLALLVALVQGTVPLVGASVRSRPLMDLARSAALLQFGLVALAFAVFMHAHIVSDFSVRNVFENSNTAKPMLYKVTGVWGSHEGSMMLWVLMLTLFGGLVAALWPVLAGQPCGRAHWRSRGCSALARLPSSSAPRTRSTGCSRPRSTGAT